MLTLKHWFEPPVFPGDEEKTNQARWMNALGLYTVAILLIVEIILVPLFIEQKLAVGGLLGIIIVLFLVMRQLMFRGQVELGGILMIGLAWVIYLGMAFASGGMLSPVFYAVAAVSIIVGLLFQVRWGNLFALASILAGVIMAMANQIDFNLPNWFTFSPMVYWFIFAVVIVFMNGTMNLTVTDLKRALASAREQIQARENAETALRASEEYNKLLFTSSRTPIVVMDIQTNRYVDCNPAAIEIYQFGSRAETLGKTPLDVSTPLQYDGTPSAIKAQAYIDECARNGSALFEWRHQRPNGEIWDAEVQLMAFQANGKNLIQFSLHDITAHKRAEAQIRQSEITYRGIIDALAESVYVLDHAGTFIDVNQGAERMYGYTRQELIGKSPADVSADGMNDLAQVAQQVELAFHGTPQEIEFWGKRKDGSIFPKEVHCYPGTYFDQPVIIAIGQDITERKQAEIKLQHSEEHYRLLFEHTPVGIFSVTPQGHVIEINPSALAILGSPSAQVSKQIDFLTFPPIVECGAVDSFKKCLETRQSVSAETIYTSKWGKQANLHYQIIPIFDLASRITLLQFIMQDITERKRAEQARDDAKSRLETVINVAPLAITVLDLHDHIQLWNPAAERIFGWRAEDVMGKPNPIVDTTMQEEYTRFSQRVLSGQAIANQETIRQRKDGTPIHISISSAMIYDASGKPSGRMGIFADITAQKQNEQALRESEAKFRAIVENSNDGILFGDANANISYRSPSYARINGYSDEERLGRSGFETVHPDDLAMLRHYWGQVVQNPGTPVKTEYRIKHKDGTWRWIDTTGVNLIDNPDVREIVVTSRDITARKQAEESLRENEQMFRAMFEQAGDFAFILKYTPQGELIIHDVNETACRVHGYSREEMIGKRMADLDPDLNNHQIQERFEQILENQAIRFESIHLRKDGSTFPVEVIAKVVHIPGKSPLFFATERDISWRVKGQQQLRESEAQFRAAFMTSIDGFYISTLEDGVIVQANQKFEEIFGYTHDEVIGKTALGLNLYVDPADRAHIVSELLKRGNLPYIEIQERKKNGDIMTVSLSVNLMQLNGKPHILGSIRDITERKRAEQKIEQSEKKYRELFQVNKDGISIFVISPDQKTHNFVEVNSAAHTMLGYTEQEMLALSPQALEPNITPEQLQWRQVELHSRGVANFETILAHKDGRSVYAEFTAQVIQYENQLGVMNIVRDITERKRAERDAERHNQEMTTLYEISKTLSQTLEPAAILEQIYDAVGKALDNRNFYIALYDSAKQVIHFPIYTMNGKRTDPDSRPFGNGVTEYMIRSRAPLFIPRDLTTELPKRGIAAIGTMSQSLLAVPLVVGERVLGVMTIQDYEHANAFDARHLELFSTIATQAAIAFENAQLFSETKRRAQELATLYEISKTVSARLQVESVLESIYAQLKRILPMDSFCIALYDPSNNRVSFPLLYDKGARYQEPDLSLAQDTYTNRVIQSGESLLINRTAEELRAPVDERMLVGDRSNKAASLMFAPLGQGEQIIGVMTAQSNTLNAYTDDHLALLNNIASQVTIALQNAQLFENTERNLERMQALHEIDESISRSHDLRGIFETYFSHLTTQLGVDAAAVLLWHPATETLEYADGRGFRTLALQHTRLKRGEGFAGRVAQEQHSLVISDLTKELDGLTRSPQFAEEGFVTYFGVPLITNNNLRGVLEIFQRRPTTHNAEWRAYLETLATQAAIAIDNVTLFDELQHSNIELKEAYDYTLEGWAHALELRDQETEGHTRRVVEMTVKLARTMGIPEAEMENIRRGALLHDIGKMGIPDSVLLKPGTLNEREWEIMRRHPEYAYDLINPIEYLRQAVDIPYCHHERWDGEGYPRHLKAQAIPLAARIFAIIDVWDALTSDRPYRKAWTRKQAAAHLLDQSGKHFDPGVVAMFMKMIKPS